MMISLVYVVLELCISKLCKYL